MSPTAGRVAALLPSSGQGFASLVDVDYRSWCSLGDNVGNSVHHYITAVAVMEFMARMRYCRSSRDQRRRGNDAELHDRNGSESWS